MDFCSLDLSRRECDYFVFEIVADANVEGVKISACRAHHEDFLSGGVIRAACMLEHHVICLVTTSLLPTFDSSARGVSGAASRLRLLQYIPMTLGGLI